MTKALRRKHLPPEAYDRIPRAQLTLTDETVWLTRFDARGCPTTTYPVRAEDAAAAFALFGTTTGLLAPDTLFWTEHNANHRIAIWLPPSKRTLTFDLGKQKTTRLDVPLPGMIFLGVGINYSIYSAPERPTREDAPIYTAPLPNVDPNGAICTGTVKFPPCSPATIHQAAALFFESAFNHDLAANKFRDAGADDDDDYDEGNLVELGEYDPYELAHTGGLTVRRRDTAEGKTLFQFLKELGSKRAFPMNQLLPIGFTLKAIMGAR